MPGTVFLEGDKTSLRLVEEEDVEFLRDGVNHPGVRKYMGNRRPKNLEDEKEFFEEVVSSPESVNLLICRKDERAGIITLEPTNKVDKVAQIGIWLHPKHHGNGYGTEASKILVDYGFKQLNYNKIFARVHKDNKASSSIWKKLGFRKEGDLKQHTFSQGEYKDVIYYGILGDEWE